MKPQRFHSEKLSRMDLAKNLRSIMKEKKRSLAQLARDSKVPASTIHGWLQGRSALDLDQLKSVAGSLGVSIHRLAFGEPDPNEIPGEEVLKEIFSGDIRVSLHRIERKKAEK